MPHPDVPASPTSPGMHPPPGTTSYFDGPFTLQPYLALEVALCAILTTVMVAARLYTKCAVMKSVIWEDYACVVGWASYVAFMGIQYSCGRHGQGTHQWNVMYIDVQYNWKYSGYGDIAYSISVLATKLSIMLLIQRVFCPVQRNIPYWLTWFLIFANSAFYICFIIVPAAECIPRSKIWNKNEPGTCVDVTKLYVASGSFNLISDIAMLSIPIYLVWNLKMSTRRKVGISAIFCTGGLACVAAISRIVFNNNLSHTIDYTYTHAQPTMWSIAEVALGLLCSCLVVLPRLYQHFYDSTASSSSRNSAAKGLRNASTSTDKSQHEWVHLEIGSPKEVKLRDDEVYDGSRYV